MKIVVLGELCEDILLHCPPFGGSARTENLGQGYHCYGQRFGRVCKPSALPDGARRSGFVPSSVTTHPSNASCAPFGNSLWTALVRTLPDTDTTKASSSATAQKKDFKAALPMLPLELPDGQAGRRTVALYCRLYHLSRTLDAPDKDFLKG